MPLKVFISSTSADLPEYRKIAIATCKKLGLEPINMENWGALDINPYDKCMRAVDESDLYVGIFAHRYGFIPSGSEISMTEAEYDRATQDKLRRLCFVVDKNYDEWPDEYVEEENQSKLALFKSKVEKELIRDTFTTPKSFRKNLEKALIRYAFLNSSEMQIPPFFVGRENELKLIREALQKKTPFIGIYGEIGTGKTALLNEVLKRFVRQEKDFYMNGGVYIKEISLEHASNYITEQFNKLEGTGKPLSLPEIAQLTVRQKAKELIKRLNNGWYVLCINDLVLQPAADTNKNSGENIEFYEFLAALVEYSDQHLTIILTSPRLLPQFNPSLECIITLDEGLTTDESIEFLQLLDKSQSLLDLKNTKVNVLKKFVEPCNGNPSVLLSMITLRSQKRKISLKQFIETETLLLSTESNHLQANVTKVLSHLDDDERKVLGVIALLKKPCTEDAIKFILQPYFNNDDFEELIGKYLTNLSNWFLLNIDIKIDIQSYYRNYFYEACISDKGTPADYQSGGAYPYTRYALHYRAAEWYQQISSKRKYTFRDCENDFEEFSHRLDAEDFLGAFKALTGFEQDLLGWGYYSEVLAFYKKLDGKLDNNSDKGYFNYLYSVAFFEAGRLDKTIEYAQKALSLADEALRYKVLNILAPSYSEQGNPSQAIENYKLIEAFATQKDNADWLIDAMISRGIAHCHADEPDVAIQCFQQVITLGKEDQSDLLTNWSYALLLKGNIDEAIERALRAINILEGRDKKGGKEKGDINHARYYLALAYLYRGDFERSWQTLDRRKIFPEDGLTGHNLQSLRGLLALRRGDMKTAKTEFTHVDNIDPAFKNADILYAKGLAYTGLERISPEDSADFIDQALMNYREVRSNKRHPGMLSVAKHLFALLTEDWPPTQRSWQLRKIETEIFNSNEGEINILS